MYTENITKANLHLDVQNTIRSLLSTTCDDDGVAVSAPTFLVDVSLLFAFFVAPTTTGTCTVVVVVSVVSVAVVAVVGLVISAAAVFK